MRRRWGRLLAVSVALVATGACDPWSTSLCGTVTRCTDGHPLVGVKVTPQNDNGSPVDADPTFSSNSGAYCQSIYRDTLSVSLDKSEYRTLTVRLVKDKANDVCLEPVPAL